MTLKVMPTIEATGNAIKVKSLSAFSIMRLDFKGLITVPIHNVPMSALGIQHKLLLAFLC